MPEKLRALSMFGAWSAAEFNLQILGVGKRHA